MPRAGRAEGRVGESNFGEVETITYLRVGVPCGVKGHLCCGARLARVVTSLLAGYSRSGMSEIPVDYDPCHRLVRSERFL